MTLNGRRGPENAGLMMAEKLGYFDDADLEVVITSPGDPYRPIPYLTSDLVDIAISHQPEVAIERQRGAPIVAIGSVISEPTTALIWLKASGIHSIAELEGRTIAMPGLRFQRDLLASLLGKAGLSRQDVKIANVGYDLLPPLLGGRVDAIFGGSANMEGEVLAARGLEPVVTPVRKLGVPAYDELVVVARSKSVAAHPRTYRDFMAALARGVAAAVKDPKAVVEALDENIEGDPEIGRRALEAETGATLPLLSVRGRLNPRKTHRLLGWMNRRGFLEGRESASELLTNRFVDRGR